MFVRCENLAEIIKRWVNSTKGALFVDVAYQSIALWVTHFAFKYIQQFSSTPFFIGRFKKYIFFLNGKMSVEA
jgi:hypothetical protein